MSVKTADRADDMYLSRHQQQEFTSLMVKVGWIVDELDVTITRQSQFGDPLDGGKSAEEPVYFHEAAADVALDLHGALSSWVDEVCTQRQLSHPGMSRSNTAAKWLWQHVIDLALTTNAEVALDEIRDAVQRAERIIDRPQGRVYVGPCGEEHDAGRCGADLYAVVDKPVVKCQECGASHPVDERRRALQEEVRGLLGTATEIARMLPWILDSPVKANTIRVWAKRKRLEVRGIDQVGDARYRIGDVIDLHVASKAA